jgi:aminoglycoside 6-adenylyltransferase
MRSEQEMMDLIIGIAEKDERIRAVYMNGSRANPNIEKDIYQDYDIVYVVTETLSFINNKNWINLFGEIAIVQEPDWNDVKTGLSNAEKDFSQRYAWLMLFKDGNRIDLGIEIKEEAKKNYLEDKMTILLLDKDKFLPKISLPTDEEK